MIQPPGVGSRPNRPCRKVTRTYCSSPFSTAITAHLRADITLWQAWHRITEALGAQPRELSSDKLETA